MLHLATEIPDLMSDFFNATQQKRESTVEQLAPWKTDPCAFHMHPSSGGGCPRAFGGKASFEWPSIEARVLYHLQDSIHENVSYVTQVKDEIDTTSARVVQAVN